MPRDQYYVDATIVLYDDKGFKRTIPTTLKRFGSNLYMIGPIVYENNVDKDIPIRRMTVRYVTEVDLGGHRRSLFIPALGTLTITRQEHEPLVKESHSYVP